MSIKEEIEFLREQAVENRWKEWGGIAKQFNKQADELSHRYKQYVEKLNKLMSYAQKIEYVKVPFGKADGGIGYDIMDWRSYYEGNIFDENDEYETLHNLRTFLLRRSEFSQQELREIADVHTNYELSPEEKQIREKAKTEFTELQNAVIQILNDVEKHGKDLDQTAKLMYADIGGELDRNKVEFFVSELLRKDFLPSDYRARGFLLNILGKVMG